MKNIRKFLIAIDIGNTTAHIGVFKSKRLLREYRVDKHDIPRISRFLSKGGAKDKSIDIILCSVVPEISRKLSKICSRIRAINRVYEVGTDIRVKLHHKYSNINKLGADRLVNITGGMAFYGCPFLVISVGTGITMDYVSRKGVFEGGLIIPGPRIALDALSNRTALLPKIGSIRKKSFLGRNTEDCMVSGIVEGYSAMINELIRVFRRKYSGKLKVIGTGGMLSHLRTKTYEIDFYDPTLLLRALSFIYRTAVQPS
ncbi:MAG: type III pantothenate kinase [Candidatus Omnitrophica bacterium]|nr:type III pantothenate kinase [Candidatus Omnitrophota bacterium]